MCTATCPPVQVCTVGDLKPGDRYYDPRAGAAFIVTSHTCDYRAGFKVVNLKTGQVDHNTDPTVKLARNGRGALYASRTLNGWPRPEPEALPDPVTPDDAEVVDIGGEG